MKSGVIILLMMLWTPMSIYQYAKDDNAKGKTPYEYVKPFIGTLEYGHTFPGAVVPFGMIQASPDTESKPPSKSYPWCAGYQYGDTSILGFSHTHFSGTGHSDLGDILVMPFTGKVQYSPGTMQDPDSGYRSRYSHQQEAASPGYYSVHLLDHNIKAELTTSTRVALHRYIFPQGKTPAILIDLLHAIYNFDGKVVWTNVQLANNRLITGYRQTSGWAKNRKIYFAISFSRPFESYGYQRNDKSHYYFRGGKRQFSSDDMYEKGEIYGRKLRLAFYFKDQPGPLLLKVAISGVDQEGALKNLNHEIPLWDFEKTRQQARKQWENELSNILIEGTDDEKENFYTAMYHMLLAPSVYGDVDGRYMGIDHQIHQARNFTNYSTFSLWDTYRAAHPLLTIIKPERVPDMIQSMINHYYQSPEKILPIWSFHGNETWCMIGYHAVSVIADAYLKGIRNFDINQAYQAMINTAKHSHYDGLADYMKIGYVPIDKEDEAASKTLEYAYDDYAIARMARALGKMDDYQYFMKRAANYRNIFDKRTGFMRAKKVNGSWRTPFDPLFARFGGDYTEGNAWQYSWYVPHDVNGLIKLMGGRKKFVKKLDKLFVLKADKTKYESVDDISGLIGQYVHGNEPSHHIAYLYNYAGIPYKTQERIQQIMTGLFKNTPDGLCGNDDCGQMSAWYIFSSLGFYPVCPGDGTYVIGKPCLKKASIKHANGKTFTIKAHKLSSKNIYIQSVRLNGKNWNKSYIYHQDIIRGGILEFVMGPKPNKRWASKPSSYPPSMSKN